MSDLAHVQGLMAELGPLVEEIELINQVSDRQWRVGPYRSKSIA